MEILRRMIGFWVLTLLMIHCPAVAQWQVEEERSFAKIPAPHLPDSSTTLMHELIDQLNGYLRAPLFECSGYPMGDGLTVQFFLNPFGNCLIEDVRLVSTGDTVWIRIFQELKITAGRIDWGKQVGFAHFGYHVEYSPRIAFRANLFICIDKGSNPHLHSGHSIEWLGQTVVKALHTEIDIPTIAGRVIQDTLNHVANNLEFLLGAFPKIITGQTLSDWSHSNWAYALAERNSDSLPLDIRNHRNVRIRTKRRLVENFDITGTWKSRIMAVPDHGVNGKALLDVWVDLLPDNTTDYRYEIVQLYGPMAGKEEAKALMDDRIRSNMLRKGIHHIRWSLVPAEPPYDYLLHLRAENPAEDIMIRLYVLSRAELVAVLVNQPNRMAVVRIRREKG